MTESWTQNGVEYFLVYLYDESGAPIGMQYRTSDYAYGDFDNFFYEKNLFGDIVAVYNASGVKIVSYAYDAWGNQTATWHNSAGNNIYAAYNPFRYRGYYYDTETGYYYLQSRYYNPQWGRFLNADGYINANGDLIGFNMYAYCSNNPVMYTDPTGEEIATWVIVVIVVIAALVIIGVDHAIHNSSSEGYSLIPDNCDDGIDEKGIYIQGGGFDVGWGEMSFCDLDLGLYKGTVSDDCGGAFGLEICTGQASAGFDLSGEVSAEASATAAVFSVTFDQKIRVGFWDISISERVGVIGAGVGVEFDSSAAKFEVTPPTAGWIVPSVSIDFDYAFD